MATSPRESLIALIAQHIHPRSRTIDQLLLVEERKTLFLKSGDFDHEQFKNTLNPLFDTRKLHIVSAGRLQQSAQACDELEAELSDAFGIPQYFSKKLSGLRNNNVTMIVLASGIDADVAEPFMESFPILDQLWVGKEGTIANCAGSAVAYALEEVIQAAMGNDACFKWPLDVLARGRFWTPFAVNDKTVFVLTQ